MSTEIPKQPQAGDQAIHVQPNAASHSLSQEIFANPVDFLTTLTIPKMSRTAISRHTHRVAAIPGAGRRQPSRCNTGRSFAI
jgi:hypothetical protein